MTTVAFNRVPRGRIFYKMGRAFIKTSYRFDKECFNAEHLLTGKRHKFDKHSLIIPM